MAKLKKVTEIRDDIFFRKLLDVSKNAVFIGWSGVYRKEYQRLLRDNLPHLRELSIITNAGFDSTNIPVALYVFSEQVSDSYISREYDGDKIKGEQTFIKSELQETVEYYRHSDPALNQSHALRISDFLPNTPQEQDRELAVHEVEPFFIAQSGEHFLSTCRAALSMSEIFASKDTCLAAINQQIQRFQQWAEENQ